MRSFPDPPASSAKNSSINLTKPASISLPQSTSIILLGTFLFLSSTGEAETSESSFPER